jgi:hypothetical protein
VRQPAGNRHFADPPPPISCAVEMLGVAYGPTRGGWTSFPAGARPSWIMRGAYPLHDLMEVREKGKKKRKGVVIDMMIFKKNTVIIRECNKKKYML